MPQPYAPENLNYSKFSEMAQSRASELDRVLLTRQEIEERLQALAKDIAFLHEISKSPESELMARADKVALEQLEKFHQEAQKAYKENIIDEGILNDQINRLNELKTKTDRLLREYRGTVQ